MQKLMMILLVALLLVGGSYGKLPQKGDHVQIMVNAMPMPVVYDGIVNDISDGLLGLNCSFSQVVGGTADRRIHDICIGMGSITQLQWIGKNGKPI